MNSRERIPVQQLRTYLGATLAAAHYGLGDWLRLGPEAQHAIHRQPYARFVMGLIDRWVLEPPSEAKANANGDVVVGGE